MTNPQRPSRGAPAGRRPRRDAPSRDDGRPSPRERAPRRDDRDGPPRRDFQRDDRNGPPRRDFQRDDRNGPPRRDYRRDGPPPRDFRRDDRDGPPRRDFQRDDRNGPPRRDYRREGPPPRDFRRDDRDGPPRRDFQRDDRDGPPRRDYRRDGPPRRDFQRDERDGPPRRDFQRDERDRPTRQSYQRDERDRPTRQTYQRDERDGPLPRDLPPQDRNESRAQQPSQAPDQAPPAKQAPPQIGRFRRSTSFDDAPTPEPARGTEVAPRKRTRKIPTTERRLCAAAHAWFAPAASPGELAATERGADEPVEEQAPVDEHVHVNAHAHVHVHEQMQEQGRGPSAPAPAHDRALERGAGTGRLLFLDCPSGISGDMTVAALLDLGVPASAVEEALAALPLDGYRIEHARVRVGALSATTFRVREGHSPHHRRYADIETMLTAAELAAPIRDRARRIFRRLAEAEAAVHGQPVEEVTFHEVGAIDSIVDIVGAAAALAFIGGSLAVSPLPLGRGLVPTQHGPLPLPAPATVICLQGVPTYGVDLDEELVTPTGAAIAGALGEQYVRWPSFAPERVGMGAGHRQLPGRPNVLRAVLGTPTAQPAATPIDCAHVVLEANVDDLTGELAGHAIEALLEAGALDAWLTPVTMKKGRPGLVIGVVGREADVGQLATVLLAQTSTIGVRYHRVGRVEQARQTELLPTRFGSLPVKVSTGAGAPAHVKPEFDPCRNAAKEHGVPVREVLAEVLAAYQRRGGR